MANNKDDDDKRQPHPAPILRPPGMGGGGSAPPDKATQSRLVYHGPYFLAGIEDDPTRQGDVHASQKDTRPDKSIPRFEETGDEQVDRHYGREEVLVRKDGTELHPGEWENEKEQEQAVDRSDDGRAKDEGFVQFHEKQNTKSERVPDEAFDQEHDSERRAEQLHDVSQHQLDRDVHEKDDGRDR